MLKVFVWKVRYALYFKRLTKSSTIESWNAADSWVESFGIEDYSPKAAVIEELSRWGD